MPDFIIGEIVKITIIELFRQFQQKSAPDTKETGSMISQVFLAFSDSLWSYMKPYLHPISYIEV